MSAAAVSAAFNDDSEDEENNDNNTEIPLAATAVFEDQEKKTLPDSIGDLELEVSYFIGEDVEGRYERGEEWYKAKVKFVTSEGKHNLLYEDGDVEDDVSIGRIRKIKPISPNIISNVSGNRGEKLSETDFNVNKKNIVDVDTNKEDRHPSSIIPLSEVLAEDVIPNSATDPDDTNDKICTNAGQSEDVVRLCGPVLASDILPSTDVTNSASDTSKGDEGNAAGADNNIPSSTIATNQHHIPVVIAPLLPPPDDDSDGNLDPLDKLLKSLSLKTPPSACFASPPISPTRALGAFFSPEQQKEEGNSMWSAFGGSSTFGVIDNKVDNDGINGKKGGNDQTMAIPAPDLIEKNESDSNIDVSNSKEKRTLTEEMIKKDGRELDAAIPGVGSLEESHIVKTSLTPNGLDFEVNAEQGLNGEGLNVSSKTIPSIGDTNSDSTCLPLNINDSHVATTTELDTASSPLIPSNILDSSIAKITERGTAPTSQNIEEIGTGGLLGHNKEVQKQTQIEIEPEQMIKTDVKSDQHLVVGGEREVSKISLTDEKLKDNDSVTTDTNTKSVQKEPEIEVEMLQSKPEVLVVDNFVSSFEYSPKSPFAAKTTFFPDVSISSSTSSHLVKSVKSQLGGGACGIVAQHLKNEGYGEHFGMWKGWPFDCWSCCDTDSKICPNISENIESKAKKLARDSWGKNRIIDRVALSSSDSTLLKTKSVVGTNIVRKDSTLRTSRNRSLSVDTHKISSSSKLYGGKTNGRALKYSDTARSSSSMSNLNHSHSTSNKSGVIKQSERDLKVVIRSRDATVPVGASTGTKGKLDTNKQTNKPDTHKHTNKPDINRHIDKPDINKLDTNKKTHKLDVNKPVSDARSTAGNLVNKQRNVSSLSNTRTTSARSDPPSTTHTSSLLDKPQRRSNLSSPLPQPATVRSKEYKVVSTTVTPVGSNKEKKISTFKGVQEPHSSHRKMVSRSPNVSYDSRVSSSSSFSYENLMKEVLEIARDSGNDNNPNRGHTTRFTISRENPNNSDILNKVEKTNLKDDNLETKNLDFNRSGARLESVSTLNISPSRFNVGYGE